MAVDAKTWADMKMILRDLKRPEIQEKFKSVVIDTVDIAAAACEKYVISKAGVDKLKDIAWGAGWAEVKAELEETFRAIAQMGYALFFISHVKDKTFKREDGTEYNQIVPTLGTSYNEIIKNMADIFGYAHQIRTEDGTKVVLTLRSQDGTVDTGCRFKYIRPEIDFSYEALVDALNEAIDKEAAATGNKYITDDKNQFNEQSSDLDFDDLMNDFNSLINSISKEDMAYYAPKITHIIENVLGKGKKISNAERGQEEQMSLIIYNLKDLLNTQK
jgi:hypothetical protein